MIELLVAYLLWEGEAPAEWWGLFVVILVLKILISWRRAQLESYAAQLESYANSEAQRLISKLLDEEKK